VFLFFFKKKATMSIEAPELTLEHLTFPEDITAAAKDLADKVHTFLTDHAGDDLNVEAAVTTLTLPVLSGHEIAPPPRTSSEPLAPPVVTEAREPLASPPIANLFDSFAGSKVPGQTPGERVLHIDWTEPVNQLLSRLNARREAGRPVVSDLTARELGFEDADDLELYLEQLGRYREDAIEARIGRMERQTRRAARAAGRQATMRTVRAGAIRGIDRLAVPVLDAVEAGGRRVAAMGRQLGRLALHPKATLRGTATRFDRWAGEVVDSWPTASPNGL
jgi:hypothetical protein